MSPVAITRQPHRLPGRTIDRQGGGSGQATLGIKADRACRHWRWLLDRAKQLLPCRPGGLGVGPCAAPTSPFAPGRGALACFPSGFFGPGVLAEGPAVAPLLGAGGGACS